MSHRQGGTIFPWQRGQSGHASPAFSPATRFPHTSSRNRSPTVTRPSIGVPPLRRYRDYPRAGGSAQLRVDEGPQDDEGEEEDRDEREAPDQAALPLQVHEEEGHQRRLHGGDQECHDDVHQSQVDVRNQDGDDGQREKTGEDSKVDPAPPVRSVRHVLPPLNPPGTAAGTGRSTPGRRSASTGRPSPPGCNTLPRGVPAARAP